MHAYTVLAYMMMHGTHPELCKWKAMPQPSQSMPEGNDVVDPGAPREHDLSGMMPILSMGVSLGVVYLANQVTLSAGAQQAPDCHNVLLLSHASQCCKRAVRLHDTARLSSKHALPRDPNAAPGNCDEQGRAVCQLKYALDLALAEGPVPDQHCPP